MEAFQNLVLLPRHEWMVTKVAQAFGIDKKPAEKCIRDNRKKIDAFLLDPTSPAKIFFFYQPRQFKMPELYMSTVGDGDKLENKCVWFLRNTSKPVDPKEAPRSEDTALLFGELHPKILETYETTLSQVYGPLLKQAEEWGELKREADRQQFIEQLSRFDDDLQRKIENLKGEIVLRVPRSPYDKVEQKPAAYQKAAANPDALREFRDVMEDWCASISEYLDKDPSQEAVDDKGPDDEIDNWSKRMLNLISITEQLKTKPSRVVTGVLKARVLSPALDESKSEEDALNELEEIKDLVERWRTVDLRITDHLNEAKDNVRFLENLRKVVEPLKTESLQVITDSMSSLLNSLKMIHTLSRHYGTETRMSNLFQRITNQLIARCKEVIRGDPPRQAGSQLDRQGEVEEGPALWDQPPDAVIAKIRSCITLYEEYQRHYKETKARLAQMPKGKQFNFDETVIFGKFTLFRRRLEKIEDMFSSMKQFQALKAKRIDGLEPLIASFEGLIRDFRNKSGPKGHELLRFTDTAFEREFVAFTMRNSAMENGIQEFLQTELEHKLSSIEKRLDLLQKFEEVLHREALVSFLDQMYQSVFKMYGQELTQTEIEFRKHKDNPPIARNMPPVAGKIQWTRQLWRQIRLPIMRFVQKPQVFASWQRSQRQAQSLDASRTLGRSSRPGTTSTGRLDASASLQSLPGQEEKRAAAASAQQEQHHPTVELYNRVFYALRDYQDEEFAKWVGSCDEAKRGLRRTLLVVHQQTGRLHVNFDHKLLELIREAKHLQLMMPDLPNTAKIVLLLEDKLKAYHNEITHALSLYNRVTSMVPSTARSVLTPHLRDLELAIRPACTTMTWTSMNIEQFLSDLHAVLRRFENLVVHVQDVLTNRVQHNLDVVSSVTLLDLPNNHDFSIRDFLPAQKAHIDKCVELINAKNVEIERAVSDLLDTIKAYPFLDTSAVRNWESDEVMLKLHVCHQFYHALAGAVMSSINALRRRIATREARFVLADKALFKVDVSLQAHTVTLTPSLAEIHEVVNAAGKEVLHSTKRVLDWGIDAKQALRGAGVSQPGMRKPLFDKMAADKNLAVAFLLLAGAVEDAKLAAIKELAEYKAYSWLWETDPEKSYNEFVSNKSRILEDFVAKLQGFVEVGNRVNEMRTIKPVGALNFHTGHFKRQLDAEVEGWKKRYAQRLHQEAKRDMESMIELMDNLRAKLEREIRDFASLKSVMDAQAEVREVQSWIDASFDSIIERYNTLEKYVLSDMTKDEMDAKSVLRSQWQSILNLATEVMGNVSRVQGSYKQDLLDSVRKFRTDVARFKADWDVSGPMVKGTTPIEAITRLNKFDREFETLDRNRDLYNGGEKLFGLPEQRYPDLELIERHLGLLKKLYNLYKEVLSAVEDYKNIAWIDVMANIKEMNDTVQGFAQQCKQLPKSLRDWEAYQELSQEIDDFLEVLPLLQELSKPAMRPRHWKRVSDICKIELDPEHFDDLKLRTLLDANLLEHREQIEEETDKAEKERVIEEKLRDIQLAWDAKTFEFGSWHNRGEVIFSGLAMQEILEENQESLSSLMQMRTYKHISHFAEPVQAWLKKLEDVEDTLKKWNSVQDLWTRLEVVFMAGDIARQMQAETNLFKRTDAEWIKMMTKAKELRNVVDCCQNEYIRGMLPTMKQNLERCRKALDQYYEAKRMRFPRFYFVSDDVLLRILRDGSDHEKVQECFPKVFDSIDYCEFVGNNLTFMRSMMAGYDGQMDREDIKLVKPVPVRGHIEEWLLLLEKEMMRTMKSIVREAGKDYDVLPFASEFIHKYCAQVALLGAQFKWTQDVHEALLSRKKNSLHSVWAHHARTLEDLTGQTTSDIKTRMERQKLETLVTMQLHQRDVLADLAKLQMARPPRISGVMDFEWQKQMRCYWVDEEDECIVKVADVDTAYCYEYLGCKERLVVTPLTDRAYISLSQAVSMHYGGSPAGPAGTGKTETVKDLGRAYGKFVRVQNCSEEMTPSSTAMLFKGLAQSGSWGCFDEINRINLDVLSVVAQQVQSVLNATRAFVLAGRRKDDVIKFSFPGESHDLALDPRCGMFITMNPGYAGRVELPENLKALFRTVAMMVPDRQAIIKVKLASVGYKAHDYLAVKFRTLYELCEQQLSKQKHYDFGLRNILSVLRTAGKNLREDLAKEGAAVGNRQELEMTLLMKTLRDMNLSKLVSDDVPLFESLLRDLFPGRTDTEKRRYAVLEEAIRGVIEKSNPPLIHHEPWVNKIVQLYETSGPRHGLMMVGPAGVGKSTAIRVLLQALSQTAGPHRIERLNPKAIEAHEMYGKKVLTEWTPGIFSTIWERVNKITHKYSTWIVCDGPVDANWIENLNSVLDDTKQLTLANSDSIPMTPNVRLVFEVEDLRNASPATVSRAGIIYVSVDHLGYDPIVQAWLRTRREEEQQVLAAAYAKYVTDAHTLDWLKAKTKNVMPTTQAHLVSNCCALVQALLDAQEVRPTSAEAIERVFVHGVSWALGGLLERADRVQFSHFLLDIMGPALAPDVKGEDTLFEYYPDVAAPDGAWRRWVAPEYDFAAQPFNFSTCLVPTVDTARAERFLYLLSMKQHKPVLLVGSSGTAKTSAIMQYVSKYFGEHDMLLKKISFSSFTTPRMFQTSIEADVQKSTGRTHYPAGQRWMTVFLDDMSMPEPNMWKDQPTLEIVRQLLEDGGFYYLDNPDARGDMMIIQNLLFVGAMNHPGGGRNDIPNRLKRHFFCVNMTPPELTAIDNIYGSMLRYRFDRHEEFSEMVPSLTAATIDIWNEMKDKMLRTPSKFHYVFTMRDLSRVFQGVLHCPLDVLADPSHGVTTLVRLWKHECERVFCDKLVEDKDKAIFRNSLRKIMHQRYGEELVASVDESDREHGPFFVDFLRNERVDPETEEVIEEAPKIYEPIESVESLRARVEDFLAAHNERPGAKPMHLVLFDDALEHLVRISRILGMPRGNALLVGVGGSGRQSLARLAAFIAKHEVKQLKMTRSYTMKDLWEDLRILYQDVGKEGKKATLLVTDYDIVEDEFLEYINAILTTGEIAGLFAAEERDLMCSELREVAQAQLGDHFVDTPENLYKFFLDRIRDNLHVVLCFSPANEKFAERTRRFPGLISGCTINWFMRWPEQALMDVSTKFIAEDKDFKVQAEPEVEAQLVKHIAAVHNLVAEKCDEYRSKYRRLVHVTPKSFLSFIKSYKLVYKEKLEEISTEQRNVALGLQKLEEAERGVTLLQKELDEKNKQLKQAEREAEVALANLEVSAQEAEKKKIETESIQRSCEKSKNTIAKQKADADRELQDALPFVEKAVQAAKAIQKKDLNNLQKLPQPPPLIRRIFDGVLILMQRSLDKVEMKEIQVGKNKSQLFIADSFDSSARKVMMEPDFVKSLLLFSEYDKDNINEETMELLQPYLELPDFTPARASIVYNPLEGLCRWVIAMRDYHYAALKAKPLLDELRRREDQLDQAIRQLQAAEADADLAQQEVDRLQDEFRKQMQRKKELQDETNLTQEKMQKASNLIRSLAGNKRRWEADALNFAEAKARLVGDCALACAFVSYLGPFNHDFRKRLLDTCFFKDCLEKGIPVSKDLQVSQFLVDTGTVAEWNTQGLPKDDLSIQNGILVTQSSRYPVLVDPQGQAVNWLRHREAAYKPVWVTMSNARLRDHLLQCMENGRPLIVEGVINEVDPLFDPVLEKNIVIRGSRFQVVMGDNKNADIDPNFRLYLITTHPNPRFSPELSAKTTIIDFSVTQKGLEEQLLSRVIQHEQKALEESRQALMDDINMNTISLKILDKQLLDRLSAGGNLLEDVALINVLADTKNKAQDVHEKMQQSLQNSEIIDKKREQYRPVATRGSVIYFSIVSMSQVNNMYQTSLAQFLSWFDASMTDSEKAKTYRVQIIQDYLTYLVYENVSRGLFEADKLTFKLMMTLNIIEAETDGKDGKLTPDMVQLLLRGGALLTPDQVPENPFAKWLPRDAWMNVYALTTLVFFGDFKTLVAQNEAEFKRWFDSDAPEKLDIPRLQERLQGDPNGPFIKFLVTRCFREDRTRFAADIFIASVLGEKFARTVPTTLEHVYRVSDTRTPVVMLLTLGADPTAQIEEAAKRQDVNLKQVSMGRGQEEHAQRCIEAMAEDGGWALLQNCHLGLQSGFISKLDELIDRLHAERKVDSSFRVWLTCEPHADFPINILQRSIKVTNEPPRGMQAGLLRSYSSVVTNERLLMNDSKEWRDLVWATCFLHSLVQERRKFGSVGWCIPYEFNLSDLEASLTFLSKHIEENGGNLSWPTIQYMICHVQYGGRITNDLDRLLFETLGQQLLNESLFSPGFETAPARGKFRYSVPASDDVKGYQDFIKEFPEDAPELFRLHPNAELTYGTNEAKSMFDTIIETQPKEAQASRGVVRTREDLVKEEAERQLKRIAGLGYTEDAVKHKIRYERPKAEMRNALGREAEEGEDGLSVPLNVFLFQEIMRLNATISVVRSTLESLIQAINGEIIMTPELLDALNAVFDGKPPKHWYMDANGEIIAWTTPTLVAWIGGLLDREKQLSHWLNDKRPPSFWLPGFYNPHGFLTAAKQEMTRRHGRKPDGTEAKGNDKWSLDDVSLVTEVTDYLVSNIGRLPKLDRERGIDGVFIHGFFLEGCSWDRRADSKLFLLRDANPVNPRELYTAMPVLLLRAEKATLAEQAYDKAFSWYPCPVYTRPKRNDQSLIKHFQVMLRTTDDASKWTMRGVALLCSRE